MACRLCVIYVREDNDSNVQAMIMWLVWTIWTPMSAVPKKVNLITHSLPEMTHLWVQSDFIAPINFMLTQTCQSELFCSPDHDCDLWVTMVGWVDVPDSEVWLPDVGVPSKHIVKKICLWHIMQTSLTHKHNGHFCVTTLRALRARQHVIGLGGNLLSNMWYPGYSCVNGYQSGYQ